MRAAKAVSGRCNCVDHAFFFGMVILVVVLEAVDGIYFLDWYGLVFHFLQQTSWKIKEFKLFCAVVAGTLFSLYRWRQSLLPYSCYDSPSGTVFVSLYTC